MLENIVIIGASGTLGQAFTLQIALTNPQAQVHAFSRKGLAFDLANVMGHVLDYDDEGAIESAALLASKPGPLDLVIVATGLLHDDVVTPEKSLKALTANNMLYLYNVNTVLPAMIAKYFTPHLNRDKSSFFAILSARVGSISDNQFGGWYSYRAAKAGLNMVIKNVAIELSRRNKKAVVVGLHPGTVDSPLTKPYQKSVPEGQLFTAEYSASKLLEVLFQLSPENTGNFFAWDGEEIAP